MCDEKYVLVITSKIDTTVDYIIEKYKKVTFFRLDIDRFSDYIIDVGIMGIWSITDKVNNRKISKEEVCSIYYRKPFFPDLSEFDPAYVGMIQRDIVALITGIADEFEGKVLSKPSVLKRSENKVYQLLYSMKYNLNIPNSYIGNSNDYCKEFALKKSIIKPLTTGKVQRDGLFEVFQTSMFADFDDDISLTPVYVQDYKNKKYEVRLTVIDNYIYAVRIDTKDKVDWRKDYENHKYTVIECPQNVKSVCMKMLSDFGLKFGAFDFIVNELDEWIFLEVNPNGQWLWLEVSLGLDISQKIVDYLVR